MELAPRNGVRSCNAVGVECGFDNAELIKFVVE
jgi:hypothetical protein